LLRLSEHGAKHVLSLPELRADVGSPRVGLAAIPSQTLRFVESNRVEKIVDAESL
jgi:hypothetical protein